MCHDVFISFSTSDRHIVDKVCQYLDANNISYWDFRQNRIGGVLWKEKITNAINNCQVVIFFQSSGSNSAKEVLRELRIADHMEKEIIPFTIQDVEVPKNHLAYLVEKDRIRAFPEEEFEIALKHLLKSINYFLAINKNIPGGSDNGEDNTITDELEEGKGSEGTIIEILPTVLNELYDGTKKNNYEIKVYKSNIDNFFSALLSNKAYYREQLTSFFDDFITQHNI
jgi:hypothetical protein